MLKTHITTLAYVINVLFISTKEKTNYPIAE